MMTHVICGNTLLVTLALATLASCGDQTSSGKEDSRNPQQDAMLGDAGPDAAPGCAPTLDQSQESGDGTVKPVTCHFWAAQPFTAGKTGKLHSVALLLTRLDLDPGGTSYDDLCTTGTSDAGTLEVEFLKMDTSGPTDQVLASSSIPLEPGWNGAQYRTFDLAPMINVTAGDGLAIALRADSSRYKVYWDGTQDESSYPSQYYERTPSRAWEPNCGVGPSPCVDLVFRTYVCP